MKKVLIILVCLLLVVGCSSKKEETKEEVKEKFVLEKIDDSKDLVYETDYKSVEVSNKPYELKILTVNIKGENIENVNKELKNFVVNSFKNYQVYEGILVQGNVINHDYYVTDDYISIIQRYYMSVDTMVGDKKENVYVISLKTGRTLDNEAILKEFDLSKDDLEKKVTNKLDSTEADFELMNFKQGEYNLYINGDNKLCIIFNVEEDLQTIKKELILD